MMMKLWSCLCVLVLVISSVSRGQDQTTVPPGDGKEVPPTVPAPPLLSDETQHEAAAGTTPSSMSSTMSSTPPPLENTSANATDLLSTVFTTQEEEKNDDLVNKTSEEVSISTAAQTKTPSVGTTWSGNDGKNVDMTAASTSKPAPTGGAGQSSWGYVLLVLILLVIVVLCVILYFLRRVSRTYSFDLHRQVPSNHPDEPTGTFEPVYLDDLDRADQVTTSDLSPPPVSNGTTLQSDERGSNGESAPQEQPDANGLMETSPTSNTSNTSNNSPSLGDGRADRTPSLLSNLFFDAMEEEQQNENNNNPSVCSSDPFVEINLDEPAWCGQLLTSPEAPSSVLPFSPFSFSSSSLSSSS